MQTWWRSQNELDQDQRAIMGLPSDGSYALIGPPGSGKTNLLLMRAAYLSTLRRNVAVVVLNRSLAEFIKSGAVSYGLQPRSVFTSQGLVSAMAREARIQLDKETHYNDSRAEALRTLTEIRERTGGPIYDAILIDEAQDHGIDEIRALRALARDIFLTSDSRQSIYDGGNVGEGLSEIVDETRELRFHYRSSPDICDLADRIGGSFTTGYARIAPTSRYPLDGPRENVRIDEGDLQRQAEIIADRLPGQIRAHRGQLLGVIAPRREDVGALADHLRRAGLGPQMTVQTSDAGYLPLDPAKPICLSTVHGAKGLEFQAVHFAGAETVKTTGPNQKRVAFTAVTRAKSGLSVYHEGRLPGYLDAALSHCREKGVVGDWTSIFNA